MRVIDLFFFCSPSTRLESLPLGGRGGGEGKVIDIYAGGDFTKGWWRLMNAVFDLTRGGRLCMYCYHF